MAKEKDLGTALQEARSNAPTTIKTLLAQENVKKRFEEILGKKAQGFISSVINVAQNNNLLAKAEPQTILSAAVVAATLDLPIDPNLGFSYIVPYSNKAQFQMGYRGFIQLALRSGQYQKMNVVPVYENQFKSYNKLTEELDADFSLTGEGEVKGYAAYFKLLNGFEKTAFFYKEDLLAHGKRYSKSFNNGPWQTHTDEMCMKTAIKLTLSKWGILSIEMQTAIRVDQGVINDANNLEDIEYTDIVEIPIDYENVRDKIERDLKADANIKDEDQLDVFDQIKKESEGKG